MTFLLPPGIKGLNQVTIFAKSSNLDIWLFDLNTLLDFSKSILENFPFLLSANVEASGYGLEIVTPKIFVKTAWRIYFPKMLLNCSFWLYKKTRLWSVLFSTREYETLCLIWYHLYNIKNVKNTHERVFL